MTNYPLLVSVIALATTALGVLGLVWARHDHRPVQVSRGCRLFSLALGLVGALILFSAVLTRQSVLAFGLVFGGLFIAMLWGGVEEVTGAARPAPDGGQ